MNLGARFDLARGKDLTLGVLMERLAAIHGDRPLVTEAESGRVRTFRQAAADVDRWAGAIHALTEPGNRLGASLAAGDLNTDGKTDLAVANSHSISILLTTCLP